MDEKTGNEASKAEGGTSSPVLLKRIDLVTAAFIAIFSICAVAGALSELQKRDEIEMITLKSIQEVEQTISERLNVNPAMSEAEVLSNVVGGLKCEEVSRIFSKNAGQYRKELRSALEAYKIRIAGGKSRQIESALQYLSFIISCKSAYASDFLAPDMPVKSSNITDNVSGFFDGLFIYFGNMTNNSLLVIVVVGCGCLGALVSGIRTDTPSSLKDMVVGAAAGFMVYLGMKGGKYIFITHAGYDYSSMNHYGIAFASVVVGLYVDWAHNILKRLLNGIENNIAPVNGGNTERKAAGKEG